MFIILFELIIFSDLITLTNTISFMEKFVSQEPQDNLKIIYKSFNEITNITYEVIKNFLNVVLKI